MTILWCPLHSLLCLLSKRYDWLLECHTACRSQKSSWFQPLLVPRFDFLGEGGCWMWRKAHWTWTGASFSLQWNLIWVCENGFGVNAALVCAVSPKKRMFISNISCIFAERHIYLCILLTVQVIVRIGHHQLFQAKCCFSIAVERNKKNSQPTKSAKDVSYFCLNNCEAQDASCLINL